MNFKKTTLTLGVSVALSSALADDAVNPMEHVLVTLPIHPRFAPDPEYYRPYGIRLISDTPHADGGIVRLHLCEPPSDVMVDACYWSAASLESALTSAGFSAVTWRTHHVDEEGLREIGPDFWQRYLEAPHAAILDCRK